MFTNAWEGTRKIDKRSDCVRKYVSGIMLGRDEPSDASQGVFEITLKAMVGNRLFVRGGGRIQY